MGRKREGKHPFRLPLPYPTLAPLAWLITNSSIGTVADAGDAGNITIQSGSTVVLNNSSITTEAREASGGQIEINAPEMIRLTNSRISTSVKGVVGDSDGGNITIDPQFVILQNSQVIARAFAGSGGATFPNSMIELARMSKHLTPDLLAQELRKLDREDISVYAYHLKPAYED